MKLLCLILTLGLALAVSAKVQWWSFWPENPDDSYEIAYPILPGHPKTNEDFHKILTKVSKDWYRSQADFDGQTHTFFWTARVESDIVDNIWEAFELVTAHSPHTDEGDPDELDPDNLSLNTTPTETWAPTATPPHALIKRGIEHDKNAPRQLRMISAPASANNKLDGLSYNYDGVSCDHVRLYVVDTGWNKASQAIPAGHVEWIFARPFPKNQEIDCDPEQHGTILLDLAAGKDNGVCRNADVTAAMVSSLGAHDYPRDNFIFSFGCEQLIDALARIINDRKGHGDKAVVSISLDFRFAPPEDRWETCKAGLYSVLAHLTQDLGVSVVVASTNGRKCSFKEKGKEPWHQESYPCQFGNPLDSNIYYIPELIVVGSARIDNGGCGNDAEPEDWYTVWAPGDDQADGRQGFPGLVADTPGYSAPIVGTSSATAFAAGLVTYFRSLGMNAVEAKQRLIDLAYARKEGGPKIIWNGVE